MEQTKMKYWSIVLLTINSIIGIGIFLSPGGVIKMVGSVAPWIYLIAAVFTTFLAVTFAAAAKYVVKGGASYAYSKAAFGDGVGFYIGITRVVAASIAWGVMATAVVKSIYGIFGIEATYASTTVGFLVLMAILLIINTVGIKILTKISDLSTIGKLLALVLTIVAGLIIIMKTGENHLADVDLLKNDAGQNLIPALTVGGVINAVIAAFYAFTGFESIASGSTDMEEPEKNLPRAIPLAIGIIAVVYFGIIFVAMAVDSASLVTSNQPVVLASIFQNTIIKNIVIIGAIISMFGISVAGSFHTPRILEAIAKEGQAPAIFQKRMLNDVPVPAFLLTAIVAIVIPMTFGYKMGDIIIISSISRFLQFIVVPLAVIAFYYGKNKQEILVAKKNFVTDVIFPIVSIVLTVILLYYFDWVGKFSTTTEQGTAPNYYAIASMIIGYVVLPIVLWFGQRKRCN